ncbi:MAG: hypothetical protein QM691_10215 [Opitutaceae bacterium]
MAWLAHSEGLPFYFVAAGDFSQTSCGDDYGAIAAACSAAPDNFLFLPERLVDGPDFNAHVVACDVLVAAYIDVPFQSNLLTKAAAFSKPVVVSRGYVMERHTIDYGLGIAVPQGDAHATLAAIKELLQENRAQSRVSRREEYLQDNGPESLDRLLVSMLDVCSACG